VLGVLLGSRERKSLLTLIHHGARLVKKIYNLLSILSYHSSRMVVIRGSVGVGLTNILLEFASGRADYLSRFYSQEPFYLLRLGLPDPRVVS
jgi:hypothetical protein